MKRIFNNKKGIAPLMLIIIILILGGLIAGGFLKLGSLTGSGSYIERPVFKYIKCEAVGSLKYSSWASPDGWLIKPSVTNQYNVKIKATSVASLSNNYIEYSVCNSRVLETSNCRVYKQRFANVVTGKLYEINNLRTEEVVYVQYYKIFFLKTYTQSNSWLTYQLSYIPYGLREYDVLSGSGAQITSNDCEIPSLYSTGKAEIKSDDISKTNVISPKSNERVLQPEEVRWYVTGYLTSASPSFMLKYQGYDAWCRSTGTTAEIYKINTITTSQGTYKIASPDWSDYLGSVTCCPKSTRGDEVCSDSFAWVKIAGSECGAFKSCGSPNFVPYSTEKIIRYSCVNGYCKSEVKAVECSSDYDCKDTNQVCDLNKWACVNANVDLTGQEIKTIADNSVDCKEDGGRWITEKTIQKSFWNYLGFGEPKVIVNEYCAYPKPWWMWALIIAGILLFIIIVMPKLMPFFRRFLPK
jgi:hypothetical protein